MTTPGDPSPGPSGSSSGWGPPPGWGAPVPPLGDGPHQGYGPPPAWSSPQGYGPPSGPSSQDTTWAVLVHLSFFVLGVVGPLVAYLVKKDSSPFVRQHAAEAFDFHVTVSLAAVGAVVLMLLLVGFLLLPVVLVGAMVLSVLAAMAAGRGEPYRYPLTIRFLS